VDKEYGAVYRDLHERHWWWRAREGAVLSRIERLRLSGASILDVGCGDGLWFERLARFGSVEGVEPDGELVSESARRERTIYLQPFDEHFQPGKRYDLILFLDVLEHLDAPRAALAHAATLLAPRGVVLVTVPAFQWLWTAHDEINRHRRRYRRGEVVELLAGAGFEVEEARYLFFWTVAGKLVERTLERLGFGSGVARVPAAVVNRALLALTRLDLTIGLRLALPAGTSVLARGRLRAAGAVP
jgi:2-polyprenyl-3-methyl-5-hydroxy-6-metoxy-1,4-benzoquinol methylase